MTNRNITKPVAAIMYFLPSDELKMFETMFIGNEPSRELHGGALLRKSNKKLLFVNKH